MAKSDNLVIVCFLELLEGDIEVDPSTDAIVNGLKTFDAVSSERRKWPGAKVPYVFASNFGKIQIISKLKNYYCTNLFTVFVYKKQCLMIVIIEHYINQEIKAEKKLIFNFVAY